MEPGKKLLFMSPSVAKGQEAEFKVSDFESLSRKAIGQGAFGKVYKVRHKTTGNLYAIKVIPKDRILATNMIQQLRKEVRIMYSLHHENIIRLFNHFEDKSSFYLILELAENGALFTKLRKLGSFDEATGAQYLREVALAVQYLHCKDPPIIHRDIKPENIFLDREGKAKLGDFGWSNFSEETRSTYCGTLEYLAPEMINRTGHDTRLDLWNLGILLFELLTGRAPFRSSNQAELLNKIKAAKVGFPKNFPVAAKDLVRKLLNPNPRERLSIEELLDHPWMQQHAPLRPTASLTTVRESLPDESEDLAQNEYQVISAKPKPEELLQQEVSLRARLRKKNLEAKEKLYQSQLELKNLEEKQHKLIVSNQCLTNSIGELKTQAIQSQLEPEFGKAYDPEKIQSSIETYQSSLKDQETQHLNKEKALESLKSWYQDLELQTQTLDNTLRVLKTKSRAFKWFSPMSNLMHKLQELKRIIPVLDDEDSRFIAKPVLENLNVQLRIKPEIEKFIESQQEDIHQKRNMISELQEESEQLKKVQQLKACIQLLTHSVKS